MKILREKTADILASLGYPIGILFTDSHSGEVLQIDPRVFTEDEIEEELTYRLKTGYDNYRFFLPKDIFEHGALHITFDDGSNPYVMYYLRNKTIMDMLTELARWKVKYDLHDTYVEDGILYVKAAEKSKICYA